MNHNSSIAKKETSKSRVRILIYKGREIVALAISDILYAYTDNKYCFVCTGNDLFHIQESLENLEEKLGWKYFRINRQFIISYKIIDKIFLEDSSKIRVALKEPFNDKITISRRRSIDFRKWLELVPE